MQLYSYIISNISYEGNDGHFMNDFNLFFMYIRNKSYSFEMDFRNGTASTYPEPKDKEDFIRKQLYDHEYDGVSALPSRYTWPEEATSHFSKM